jgi:hypothetical protein
MNRRGCEDRKRTQFGEWSAGRVKSLLAGSRDKLPQLARSQQRSCDVGVDGLRARPAAAPHEENRAQPKGRACTSIYLLSIAAAESAVFALPLPPRSCCLHCHIIALRSLFYSAVLCSARPCFRKGVITNAVPAYPHCTRTSLHSLIVPTTTSRPPPRCIFTQNLQNAILQAYSEPASATRALRTPRSLLCMSISATISRCPEQDHH